MYKLGGGTVMNAQEFADAITYIKYERGYNSIRLAKRELSTAQMSDLAEAITLNSEIECVYLESCHINDEGIQAFVDIFQCAGRRMKVLSLVDNCIGADGANALAQLRLYHLSLKNNIGIGDRGAKALAKGRFVSLNLSLTGVGDEGARALAGNCHIQRLNLSYNYAITSLGAYAISSVPWLKKLVLTKCNMTDEAIWYYEDRAKQSTNQQIIVPVRKQRWSLWCCMRRQQVSADEKQPSVSEASKRSYLKVSAV